MPTIKGPKIAPGPAMGMENDTRLEKSRAFRYDFVPEKFVDQIEIKGYRLSWERAAECPCAPTNKHTKQPDPNCPLCFGNGWLYFRPANYAVDASKVGQLDDVQQRIIDQGGVVIRGIMTGLQWKADPYDKVGRWVQGMSTVTVRSENQIGYYDRFTNLDSEIVFSENVKYKKGAATLKTRYPVVALNLLRSVSTVFTEDDFELDRGTIKWVAGKGPKGDDYVTVHYLMHPTWIAVEHPQSIRDQYVNKKQKRADLPTPIGVNAKLPIRGTVMLDFLPRPDQRRGEE